jgi:hypothetical protein
MPAPQEIETRVRRALVEALGLGSPNGRSLLAVLVASDTTSSVQTACVHTDGSFSPRGVILPTISSRHRIRAALDGPAPPHRT